LAKGAASVYGMKWRAILSMTTAIAAIYCGMRVDAQTPKIGVGKDFKFPDYYAPSNGVRRLKTLVTGSEAQLVTNNVVRLKNPRMESFTPEGKLEWTATSPECTVFVASREVRGDTNLFFRTGDERWFLSGVGFFWQQNSNVLTLFDQTFTWIDKQALTNSATNAPTSK
jgi:hypothetical protein